MSESRILRRGSSGFTLVELLVVLAVIAIIAAITIPAISGMIFGSTLTVVSQQVIDRFEAARLSAITENRPAQIRIYKYSDANHGNVAGYYAIQSFIGMSAEQAVGVTDPYTPTSRIFYLPRAVVINSNSSTYSTLLTLPASSTTVTLPNGASATYIAVNIYPDGSTSLNLTTPPIWCLTLNYGSGNQTTPVNYCNIVIDPLTGKVTMYRP